MAKATLYGPNGKKEVVDVGSQRASTLQSQGWGLTPGSYKAPKAASSSTPVKKATLFGPNGQKEVVDVGSSRASQLQSQGWGLTANTAPTISPSSAAVSNAPTTTPTKKATLFGPNGQKEVVDVGSARASQLQSQGWGLSETSAPAAPAAETQADVDKRYAEAAAANPAIAALTKGGSTLEEIINGLSTGNISGLLDWEGKPFSVEDQQAALAKGMEDNRLYYEAMQAKDKADVEAALAQKQADYQDYLINSGQAFQSDKSAADQAAADSGILFSGSRVQKEKNLARAYEQDQATKQRNLASSIGSTARDFQYKYGNEAASGLSKYYNLGGNTYNPSTATGGVASSGLSSIYNPSQYNFQGTANTERKANANTRAAGYLWNKGNKLLATGYNNKY